MSYKRNGGEKKTGAEGRLGLMWIQKIEGGRKIPYHQL